MSLVLQTRGLTLRRGDRVILDGVDLAVGAGDFVALTGESGGGKTTLLRAVAGLVPFDDGTVELGEVRLVAKELPEGRTARDLRRSVGLVFQTPNLFGHLDVLRNVTLAPVHVLGVTDAEAGKKAATLLDLLAVAHRANAFPSELSGGEAQRVAIARALAMEPPLLLMDEPTAALDHGRRRELGELLRTLNARGTTLVVATHDLEFARSFAGRTVSLAGGRLRSEGTPG